MWITIFWLVQNYQKCMCMMYGEKGACGKQMMNCKWSFDDLCQLGDDGKTKYIFKWSWFHAGFSPKQQTKGENQTLHGAVKTLDVDVTVIWTCLVNHKTNCKTSPQHVDRVSLSEESYKQNILCILHVIVMFLEVGSYTEKLSSACETWNELRFEPWGPEVCIWIWLDVEHIL